MYFSRTKLYVCFRCAVLFKQFGVQPGDIVHSVVGNENMVFPITFGVRTLGAAMSNGDINLEARAIALQVKRSSIN